MRSILALAGLLLAAEGLLRAASFARSPFTLDIGPSTGAYLTGFSESEERPPVSFRWTGREAGIDLTLRNHSRQATLLLRYARFIDQPARAHIYLSGQPAASFTVRPGRFRVQRFQVSLPEDARRLMILVEDPDPAGLGLAVDWIRFEDARWSLPLSILAPRLLIAGIFLLCLACGFPLSGALLASGGLAAAQAVWASLDPFGLAHASSKIAFSALLLGSASAALLRREVQGRWVLVIFLAGYLLKGAGLFYPSYFYPDVRNHRRYVFAMARASGSLSERGLAAQMEVRTAYPRTVAGKVYAFPYSPLFFVPFLWLPREPHLVEEAMKHVSLAAAAGEVLVVYWLGRLLFGPTSGVAAALLAAFLPPMYSRLLLAMWPTIAGHLLDTLAIAAAAFWATRPESIRRMAGFSAITLVSFLTYIASLFNLSAFAVSLSLLERRLAFRLLAVATAAALATVAMLYGSFALTFLSEIAPALLRAQEAGEGGPPAGGFLAALERIPLFYGYGYPALAVAGLALARRRSEPVAFRVLAAYAFAFVLLVSLRGASDLFKDLKEILFAGPLFALTAGRSLAALESRGRSGNLATALVACGLVAFGLGKYGGYLAAHTSLAGLE